MFLRRVTLLKEKIQDMKSYPFSVSAIKDMETLDLDHEVTFFVGENGSGKSTLLEAIAYQCEFNTAGGGRNNAHDVDSSQAALGDYIRLSWLPKVNQGFFLRSESFYHFATHLDQLAQDDPTFNYEGYGGRSLHHQSHGESFLSLFLNRFRGRGIYLLDEPEAALSPARQLAFLRIIHQLVSTGNAQFIIATHSPILLGYPKAKIYSFDSEVIESVSYEDTEHYQITKGFLNRKERYLEELFKKEEESEEG
ncbi:AAA family ATPase [Ammoniphilus sp. CFH 90114]|uniref:AAA family ATPase n=1 Tax=Ammoniphilus sp. CFH 90114 TaxID=2493665 RepID=UPI00100F8676|nr:AAA family ATPase [Ammoniphilus sp. CFH 90114]RXT07164.1 ATP-binding cassette domain-containing protein [Ammoniphilus sp. CFH 90114]